MSGSALVTGAAGFIGTGIVRALTSSPDIGEVIGFDREAAAGVSLRGDIADVARVAGDCPAPAIVIHCAGITTAACERDPAEAYRVNLEGTRRLLAWCATLPYRLRFVFTSSVAVFGGGANRVDESSAVAPASTYGTVKAAAELLVLDAARRGEVDGMVLRLPVTMVRTMRSGRPGAGYLSDLVVHAVERRPLVAPLPPDQPIPVAGSRDVFAALADAAVRTDLPGRVLHVAARSLTGHDVLAALRDRGFDPQVRFEPDPTIEALTTGWPKMFESLYADDGGFGPAASLDAILDGYLGALPGSLAGAPGS
ncbi:MAG: NAD-dependent epimerase/dehydratase family protein [Methylobacteriaceae bacterium]|nr:NAD-dependent epimerase/dehydratase family protein [Methylobacteriaceae bacterium]MBV9407987.1 NAD-dependent epimerase/dehydratase family protein [Candidatus Eremiobacteraeota bacterium]